LSTSSWQTFGNVKAVVPLLAVQVVSVIKDDDAKLSPQGQGLDAVKMLECLLGTIFSIHE
jgi:hypothetical protein